MKKEYYETCQRNKRNVESLTRVSKDNDKQIFQVPISAIVQDIPFNNKNNNKDNIDNNEEPAPHNSLNTTDKENQEKRRLRTKKV
jgi:hypothetical protein